MCDKLGEVFFAEQYYDLCGAGRFHINCSGFLLFPFRLFPESGVATAEITAEIHTKIWHIGTLPPAALSAAN